MAYTVTSKNRYEDDNKSIGFVYEFTCDSAADVQNIPLTKDVHHGSQAIVFGEDLSVSIYILGTASDGKLAWRGPF